MAVGGGLDVLALDHLRRHAAGVALSVATLSLWHCRWGDNNGCPQSHAGLNGGGNSGDIYWRLGLSAGYCPGISDCCRRNGLDIGRQLFGVPILAYGFVFCLPMLGMLAAVLLLKRVDVSQFRQQSQVAIAKVLAEDLE